MKLHPAIASIAVLGTIACMPAQAQRANNRPVTADRVSGNAARQFSTLDTNRDGIVDKAEMDAAIEAAVAKLRAKMQARFDEADANKDGKLSREEFLAARAKWFAEVDTNGDGVLDQNELRAWNRAHRAK